MDSPDQETIFPPLGGKVYRFRPTAKLVIAVEKAMGEPCSVLGFRVARSQASLGEISVIIRTIVLSTDPKAEIGTPDEVADQLFEDGLTQFLDPVASLLLMALRGNKEHRRLMSEEAAKAAAAKGQGGEGETDKNPPQGDSSQPT